MDTKREVTVYDDPDFDSEVLFDIDLVYPEDHVSISKDDIITGAILDKLNYIEESIELEKMYDTIYLDSQKSSSKFWWTATILAGSTFGALACTGTTNLFALLGSFGCTAILYAKSLFNLKNLELANNAIDEAKKRHEAIELIRDVFEPVENEIII